MANVVQLNGQGRVDRGFRIEKGKQILTPTPVKMERPPITPRPVEKVVQTIRVAKREPTRIKVAAYCRVSTLLESQESSIAAQRTHYHDYICANSEWELAGVYLEVGVSGTKAEARPELQRMMADCRAGKIQMILTKSISRFARNTSDCLEMVRNLVALGVNIQFEKEKIDTGTMGSELMLSILACLAEDESRSISGNMKWGIRKRFENGSFILSREPYGYRKDGDELVVVPEEAEVVKAIFNRDSNIGVSSSRVRAGHAQNQQHCKYQSQNLLHRVSLLFLSILAPVIRGFASVSVYSTTLPETFPVWLLYCVVAALSYSAYALSNRALSNSVTSYVTPTGIPDRITFPATVATPPAVVSVTG